MSRTGYKMKRGNQKKRQNSTRGKGTFIPIHAFPLPHRDVKLSTVSRPPHQDLRRDTQTHRHTVRQTDVPVKTEPIHLGFTLPASSAPSTANFCQEVPSD